MPDYTYHPTPYFKIRWSGQWLVRYPWVEVLTVNNAIEGWKNYLSTITQAYHHFFLTKTLHSHPAELPWMTARIKMLMEQRLIFTPTKSSTKSSVTKSSEKLLWQRRINTQTSYILRALTPSGGSLKFTIYVEQATSCKPSPSFHPPPHTSLQCLTD